MAKKHKHEEHVNHERWLVSFADMMTLLFALFVVLYAIGVTELAKVQDVTQSIQFAFHIAGEGKTKDTGIFEKQMGGGDVSIAAPLITSQDGVMREFLAETLPQFQEAAGRSIEHKQTDDSIALRAPLSVFFEPGKPLPVKASVFNWLHAAVSGSLTFTSDIRIVIEAPSVIVGEAQEGDRMRPVTSEELCWRRLRTLRHAILTNPDVRESMVGSEFRAQKEITDPLAALATAENWEDRAEVVIVFSNARPQ